jgi:hypothetical protein
VKTHSREETEKVNSVLIENEEIKSALMKEESHLAIETVTKETRERRDTLLTVPSTNTEQQCDPAD